jgi:CheY-like chemotaxis protein
VTKLLIADDDDDIRMVLRIAFERGHYDVTEAADGPEALRMIREQRPHVVLLDDRMPGLNGRAVCRAIRRDHQLVGTKVVMISASDPDVGGDGADRSVAKPFSLRRLRELVRQVLVA